MTDDLRILTRGTDPLIDTPSGLRARKHARTSEIDLTEYLFETGMNSAPEGPHAHSFSTAVLIRSGRFELEFVDGRRHELVAGDSYVAGAGEAHVMRCLESGSYVVAKPLTAVIAHDHSH